MNQFTQSLYTADGSRTIKLRNEFRGSYPHGFLWFRIAWQSRHRHVVKKLAPRRCHVEDYLADPSAEFNWRLKRDLGGAGAEMRKQAIHEFCQLWVDEFAQHLSDEERWLAPLMTRLRHDASAESAC